MKIKVTQEDIDAGSGYRFDPTKCTMARALKRQLPWWRTWGWVSVGVDDYSTGFFVTTRKLPANAALFVHNIIAQKPVEPIEFEI